MGQRVACRTLWQSCARHLLENGYDIRTVRQLVDHKNVARTPINTHLLAPGHVAQEMARVQ
jgi:site-specific recombinase XerD